MFDVGFFELLVIAVVSLVVIGPDKLPTVAKTVGLWLGKIRAMVSSVQDEIQDELKKHEDEINRDLAIEELKKARDQVNTGIKDVTQGATIMTGPQADPEVTPTPPPQPTTPEPATSVANTEDQNGPDEPHSKSV